mmetsp:Transcript_107137/g.313311  ORF Transcript_107137/g.313311 Transcript_107137/m.313311 type:complete len:434 (-) Transcript_107137:153-1454(-)
MISTSFCCLALSTWQCLILILHSNTGPAFADRYTPDVLSTDAEVHLQADELVMPVDTHSGRITSAANHSDAEQSMFSQVDRARGSPGSFYTAIVFNKEFVQQFVKQDVQLIVNMYLRQKEVEDAKVLWESTSMQLMPPTLTPKLKGLPVEVMWCHLSVSLEFAAGKICLELKWYFGKKGFVFFHADISEECQASIPNHQPSWLRNTRLVQKIFNQFDKLEMKFLEELSTMASFPTQCVQIINGQDTTHFLVEVAEVLDSYPNLGFVISWRETDSEAVIRDLKAFPGEEVMQRMKKTQTPSVAAIFSPEAVILAGAPLKKTNLAFKALDVVSYGLTPGQKLLNMLIKSSGAAPSSHISHAAYVPFGDGAKYEKVKGMIVMPGVDGLVREIFTESELNNKLFEPKALQEAKKTGSDGLQWVHERECIGFRDAQED